MVISLCITTRCHGRHRLHASARKRVRRRLRELHAGARSRRQPAARGSRQRSAGRRAQLHPRSALPKHPGALSSPREHPTSRRRAAAAQQAVPDLARGGGLQLMVRVCVYTLYTKSTKPLYSIYSRSTRSRLALHVLCTGVGSYRYTRILLDSGYRQFTVQSREFFDEIRMRSGSDQWFNQG